MIKFGDSGQALLNDLLPDSMNPRVMPDREMKSLMAAIREFGFVQPVVVRKDDGLIIGGHQRLEALKRCLLEDGVKTTGYKVPVIWVSNLTDEKARMLNVALNKIHGEWDFEKLGELFASIQTAAPDTETTAMEVTGFSGKEIDDILKMTSAETPADLDAGEAPVDVDAELAARARKFVFDAATDEDAAIIREALAVHGMTSPTNAGTALAAVARAALTHRVCEDSIT